MNWIRTLLAVLAALAAFPALAHEFWLWPQTFTPAPGARLSLTLHVGENFVGEQAGFTSSHAERMQHYAAGQSHDMRSQLPAATVLPEFHLTVNTAGTHLIAYDSYPSSITLPAQKFHDYLREEGLEHIIRQREQAGLAGTPGRERYRRHIKTLLQAGGKTDPTYAVRTRQRLEILPMADPHRQSAGDALPVKLLFDGKPVPGALIKAWHRLSGQTIVLHARTGPDGQAELRLPQGGAWMISAVHMVKASDAAGVDWDSFWGNLTFHLPSAGTGSN